MKGKTRISNAVIRRLPRYRRVLGELKRKDEERISSSELGKLTGYTASQTRQDFNNFGGFGQQGYGYNVPSLYTQIGLILGLDKDYSMVIVGSGNLRQAIANYANYYKKGFIISAMFDVNPKLIGIRINDIEVRDYEELSTYLKENSTDIGIICTSKNSAQDVANKFSEGKVKGIWNFAPVDIVVEEDIIIENVHLSDSLNTLIYYINQKDSE